MEGSVRRPSPLYHEGASLVLDQLTLLSQVRKCPQYTQTIHIFTLFTEPLYIALTALSSAVLFGLIIGLAKGGFACIQHVILRLLLLRAGALPWNYPRFLDYAAERILLRKVGGGYIFIHRLLLDYFASGEGASTEEVSAIPAISDPPPAISSAPQINTAHREEKPSPPVPSRKTGSNKANRIVTLCGVVIILLALACSAGIFGVVQYSVVQIKANDATATAQVEANTTAEALANASPIAYPPQNKSPVLNDPLQDNSKGNYWEEDTSNCDGNFINRAYDINTNRVEGCIAEATDFTNFIYEVKMKIIKGDGGGIIFRVNLTGAYYDFAINQDGSYIVYAFIDGNGAVLALGSSPAIHRGLNQTNLVAAVVHGKIIELYVNHQRVAVVGGSTYTDGQIGVIVSGSPSNQAEVIFQNAKVWSL